MKDVNPDFMSLGRRDFDILNLERLASAPADSGLALDYFAGGVRHDGGWREEDVDKSDEMLLYVDRIRTGYFFLGKIGSEFVV